MKKAMVYSGKIARSFELKMKFILLFLLLGAFMAKANYDYSPNAKISLDLNEVTLLEVFNEIEDKTTFTFFYKNDEINPDQKVTIKIVQKSVPVILARLFEDHHMLYEINGKQIIVKKNQEAQIKGIVIDKATGEPIPYCNIAVESSFTGTASNELGEFVLDVDALPANLTFSHLNYEKQQLEISGTSDLIIELVPLTNILEEVVVVDSNDKYALNLASKAFKKADQNSYRRKHAKAFYRQKSKNGDAYSEFSEIIYDIHYTSREPWDWEILEGRYALRPGGAHNINYTLLSRLLTPLQPAVHDIIFPMHDDFASFYDIRIVEHILSGDDKIAVLWFKPKKGLRRKIFNAEVYVNTTSHDILKIVGSITHDKLKLVKLTERNTSWKDYSISYEIAYRQDSIQKSVIDYVKIDQEFDYYKKDKLESHTTSTSNLTFFEHYTPTSRKKMGRQFRKNKNDWQKLDQIGYNEKFWEDNPIVKRTPVEEKVIASFEKDEAFGSIFLNSKDQLVVVQSDIESDPFLRELDSSVAQYNYHNPVEKVYLHTDKDLFSAGENLWYSGYTVLGEHHQFSSVSKVLHVDLIGPNTEILVSRTHELVDGKAIGSIALPKDLISGNYQLRAYTNWMRNFDPEFFFTKTIKVIGDTDMPFPFQNISDTIDLQFFPEGGHAVAGLMGQVAFKAIGSDGLDRKIRGYIKDSEGKHVVHLGTITRGSGFFYLQPKLGEHYTAILDDGSEFPLPKIMGQGYTMTINNTGLKNIKIKIQATEPLRKGPFYIIGHINNKKYFQGKFEFEDQETLSFEMSKNGIPSGVLTLTLFDQDKKPRCERAVFVNKQDELIINARISPEKISNRNEITVDINVTDPYGEPVSTELSLAVTDEGQVVKNPDSGNILTHLLLQSDIKGHISNPGLLFKDQNRLTLHAMDLVMLTHGWRKFPWQEIQEGSFPDKEFDFAKGLTISGQARSGFDKRLKDVDLNVIAKSGDIVGMLSTKTERDGKFIIPDFNLSGTTRIVFNALYKGKTPIDVQIRLDSNKLVLPLPKFKGLTTVKDTEAAKEYSNFSATRKNMRLIYDFQNATELEEVVVTKIIEKKIEPSRPSILGQTPDATLYTKEIRSTNLTLVNLVMRFGGVAVYGSFPNYIVRIIRLGGTPLWVLNGVALSKGGAQAVGIAGSFNSASVPPQIGTMDISNVERVELLKGPAAAMWGSRGANGVFLVYTKLGGGSKLSLSPEFDIPGHATEREFYSPNYSIKLDRHSLPDYRATLYWNPSFRTDNNGNARLLFYNSDNAQKIQLSIEGLSAQGTPGAYLKTFGDKEEKL
jgi:carboxypeptidase-like protein/TonB-dependent receptor-like protein